MRFADHPEMMTAIVNFHRQPVFDLAQVFVEMSTQGRQTQVIGGFQQQILEFGDGTLNSRQEGGG
jgi:hypothetical protein